MTPGERLTKAVVAARAADEAWTQAYQAVCPRGMWPGDFRYTEAAKGMPGSELRALHDAFRAATDEHHAAWEVVRQADARERSLADGLIRRCPDLIGKTAYDASLAAVPHYPDGSPRPLWEKLGSLAQWSWERVS